MGGRLPQPVRQLTDLDTYLDQKHLEQLLQVLLDAQGRGFIGPGPIEPHVTRALQMVSGLPVPPGRALDLGSGGGLPGLPLILAWPDSCWILLEGGTTRASFLAEAVERLGIQDRVSVLAERAEEAGRGNLRGSMDLVVARSFGPPGVTAECGAPFLRVGGILLVAEPPGGTPRRWDLEGLHKLGLKLGLSISQPTAVQHLELEQLCPPAYPRRVGIPAKRPLF